MFATSALSRGRPLGEFCPSPWDYDPELLPRLQAVITEAAAVGTGARLVMVSPQEEPEALVSVRCAHQPWVSLGLTVLERGEVMHQPGAVAAPVHGARGPMGALLLYCEPGQSGLRGKYISLARAFAAHAGALLEASAGRLTTMQSTADALIQMLAAHDPATARHSQVVRRLAHALGTTLCLPPRALLDLEYGALLHDVGKIAVPVDVLQSYGPMSGPEWAVMRQHPAVGERIIRAAEHLTPFAQAVRHHHERWDGGGYPDRLAGDAIPLHARLVSLADAYEAMRVGRPYRQARTPDESIRELRYSAGGQFDPDHLSLLPALNSFDFSL